MTAHEIESRNNLISIVFDKYYSFLVCFSCKIIHNYEESKDIVIKVFNKLIEIGILLPDEEQTKKILFIYTKNACRDYLRTSTNRTKREKDFSDNNEEWEEITEKKFHETEVIKKLYESINTLPKKSKQVIRLYYFEYLSYIEISKQMSITTKSVENLLRFAKDKLKILVKQYK